MPQLDADGYFWPGQRLCAAIVDRLTFGGNLIQTGTDSYRLALTQARAAAQDAVG
ncbi:hypothetical protein GCM10010256_77940 [Streptomyces coeruleorubidus]|nr:hypothetical protein GCM10010256_77940 [Streptomyces coeruleorubidus]